jgi:hypothetical protein
MPSTGTKLVVLLGSLLLAPAVAAAQAPWHEGFEGPQVSWRDAGGDARYRIQQHQRVQGTAHTGNGSEWLRLEGDAGSSLQFSHGVGRPQVIDELSPSVWIKSDRTGLQLAARVVLPRSVDPRTGRPVVALLAGSSYTDLGRWQRLEINGIPRQLTRQLHALRMELGPQVDGREAYVDAVLLNVYGGPGVTNVWIDDLDVAGFVGVDRGPTTYPDTGAAEWTPKGSARVEPAADKEQSSYPNTGAAEWSLKGTVPAAAAAGTKRRSVRLVGSVLLVDGRPMFPRIVQHRGEPLAVLKQLGFNAAWLQRLPAPEVLEEANRLGLWLVCPPPRAPLAEIGPQFDGILAWDLGGDLTEADLEPTRRWIEQVRAADRHGQRPLICRPTCELRGYSRLTDLLLIDRRPLGTSLDLIDYGTWVRKQPLLARPGTPVWTTVQTQPSEAVRQQMALLEPGGAPRLSVSPEQVRLLAYTAAASGSRGLLFLSDSPLDAPDPATRQRAMTLELLNLELELMEPFAAAGSFVATAEASSPEVAATMLRTEHARLLLPIWSSPGAQWAPAQSAANGLALVAPGVPEASSAYELTPSGVQALKHMRVTGGMRVTLDEFGLTTQVLLAHEPLIITSLNQRAAQIGKRAAELQRQLAVRKLHTVQATAGQLATRTPVPSSAAWLDAARKSLQWCDGQLASGDVPGAALNAQRATRALRLVERSYWEATVKGLASPITSPGATSFDTLPLHWRLVDRIKVSRFGPNRIAGGDFEDLGTVLRAGWRHIQRPAPNVQTAADLVPEAARTGSLGLRLAAAAEDPENPPAVIESPPVLFVTPPVPVEAGQIVCIHGWVQAPAAISGSVDGLLIVDSLSGEALAERIGWTDGWREFALYRVAPQSGPMSVSFALSGLGEVRLDDVAIQVLEGPAAVTQR